MKPSIYKSAAVLEYDSASMEAPLLSSKGEGDLADYIVQIARRYNIPVVERPEITRTLLLAEEGTPIPEKLFRAVALVLNELEKVVSLSR